MKQNNPNHQTNTPAQTLAILAAAGAGFTRVAHRQKRPFETGWPDHAYDLAAALDHLDAGGNVGHLGGWGDLYTLDFDCDAHDLPFAVLDQPATLRKWRNNAPDRISFAIRCPEGLPNAMRGRMEIKGRGSQAVWAGVHSSGAVIQTAGDTIPALTRAEVAEIWTYRTGEPLPDPAQPKDRRDEPGQYAPRDDSQIEAIKAAWPPSAVFRRHGYGQPTTENRREVRFRGNGGLLCDDDAGTWYSFADSAGGDAVTAWAKCRGLDAGADFLTVLDEMADAAALPRIERRPPAVGDPDPQSGSVAQKIAALRLTLRALDFAAIVPAGLQAYSERTGRHQYRTGDTDRVIADAALAVFSQRGSLIARVSALELSERTGRSPNTCSAAMHRLQRIFRPLDDHDAGAKGAPIYEIDAAFCVDCDRGRPEIISQSTQMPLATHAGRDAFVRSLTRMTAEGLAERDRQRAAEDLPPLRRNREMQRRLDALTDAPGAGALLAIDALAMYGPMTRAELGAVMHRGASAISRIAQKGLAAGLLVDEAGALDVAPDWRERTDEIDATCPTVGTMQRRRLAAIDARLRYTAAALENPALTAEQRSVMHRRHSRAQAAKLCATAEAANGLEQRRGEAVDRSVILAPGQTYGSFAAWRAGQIAARRDAQAHLRSEARQIPPDSDRADTIRQFQIAGYSDAEAAAIWSYRLTA